MFDTAKTIYHWHSEVRDYEVDFQGIVNNAVYMNYLDEARSRMLLQMGMNLKTLADHDIHLVVLDAHLHFKAPLKFNDAFYIVSQISRVGKLRYVIDQQILLQETQQIMLEAKTTCCGVNAKTGKPCVVAALASVASLKQHD
jgi:acyl-CoA thioester hydrolase